MTKEYKMQENIYYDESDRKVTEKMIEGKNIVRKSN